MLSRTSINPGTLDRSSFEDEPDTTPGALAALGRASRASVPVSGCVSKKRSLVATPKCCVCQPLCVVMSTHRPLHPPGPFAGVLPFGTMFIELYFAMTSVWLGFFYYLFFFVLAVGVSLHTRMGPIAWGIALIRVMHLALWSSIAIRPRAQALTFVINIEISVLCTYVQLCSEDYNWWWPSFYRGGSVAMYVAFYSVGFLSSTLHSLTGFLPVRVLLCWRETVQVFSQYI